MISTSQLAIVIHQLMYGIAYSLCSFIALKYLFFRNAKKFGAVSVFALCSGAAGAIAVFIQLFVNDNELNIYPTLVCFYILHTLLGWLLIAEKNADGLVSLIFAQIFSISVIGSIQTAVFSLINGADKTLWQVNMLYCAAFLLSVGFVLLLKVLAKSEEVQPMSKLNMLLLTGTMRVITSFVQRGSAMSDYVPDVSPAAAIPAMLILMAVTALLLLSVRSSQAKHFRELNALSEQYMTTQARHFERAQEADSEMRMLRHDMKNHILTMNGLYHAGKIDELGEYLAQISDAVRDVQSARLTGHEVADAIINEKMKYAAEYGVKLLVSGSLKGLDIPSVPLCTILANLLDNAIEAVRKAPEDNKMIEVTAKRTGSFFYISVKNPSDVYVDTASDMPTNKTDSVHHGLGLHSVKKAVGECGGTLELCCKDISGGYEFVAEMILPVSAD